VIFVQHTKNLSDFYGTRMFCSLPRTQELVTNLSDNPVCTVPHYFLKENFNIILTYTCRGPPIGLVSSSFFFLTRAMIILSYLQIKILIYCYFIKYVVPSCGTRSMLIYPTRYYSLPFINALLSILFLNTVNSMLSLEGQVQPYLKQNTTLLHYKDQLDNTV
jgi:hypothetical protein